MTPRSALALFLLFQANRGSTALSESEGAIHAVHQLCDELFHHVGANLDPELTAELCERIASGSTPGQAASVFSARLEEWYETGVAPAALQLYMKFDCQDFATADEFEKKMYLRDFRLLGESIGDLCNWYTTSKPRAKSSSQDPSAAFQRGKRPRSSLYFETVDDVLYFNCIGSEQDEKLQDILISALTAARDRREAEKRHRPALPPPAESTLPVLSTPETTARLSVSLESREYEYSDSSDEGPLSPMERLREFCRLSVMGKREKSTQTPGQRKQRPLAWLHFETENDVLYFNCAGSCLDDQLEEILTSALASARKRLKAKRTPDPGFPNVSFGSFGTVSEEPSPKKPRSQSWD